MVGSLPDSFLKLVFMTVSVTCYDQCNLHITEMGGVITKYYTIAVYNGR